MSVAYETLNDLLLKEFPELGEQYQEALNYWEGEQPGAHVTYGDIFMPFVLGAVRERSEANVMKVCAFMETLASDGDTRTKDLMEVTVCESIADNNDVRRSLRPRLGPNTLEILSRIERAWELPM